MKSSESSAGVACAAHVSFIFSASLFTLNSLTKQKRQYVSKRICAHLCICSHGNNNLGEKKAKVQMVNL